LELERVMASTGRHVATKSGITSPYHQTVSLLLISYESLYNWRSDSQSVSPGVEPLLGLM